MPATPTTSPRLRTPGCEPRPGSARTLPTAEDRTMSKLQVIVGSTRPGRAADAVVPWVVEAAKAHAGVEVEVVALRDWSLPIFGEHFGVVGDVHDPTYSDPLIKSWNNKIREGDAYLVVTPEYNHSIPGVLKNAIDTI